MQDYSSYNTSHTSKAKPHYYLTGAYNSLSNILISGLFINSIYLSRKPTDEYLMVGYGRAQNLISFLVTSIFFLSIETSRSENRGLLSFSPLVSHKDINLAMIISIITLVIFTWSIVDIFKHRSSGASIKIQLSALVKMDISFTASIIVLFLMEKGIHKAYVWISLLIGIVIVVIGLKLLIDNANFLLDHGPGKDYIDQIANLTRQVPRLMGVPFIKAKLIGLEMIQTDLTLELASRTSLD